MKSKPKDQEKFGPIESGPIKPTAPTLRDEESDSESDDTRNEEPVSRSENAEPMVDPAVEKQLALIRKRLVCPEGTDLITMLQSLTREVSSSVNEAAGKADEELLKKLSQSLRNSSRPHPYREPNLQMGTAEEAMREAVAGKNIDEAFRILGSVYAELGSLPDWATKSVIVEFLTRIENQKTIGDVQIAVRSRIAEVLKIKL